jgi:hypothetical protein
LNWNIWIREAHRWLAVAFTLGFVANLIALTGEGQPAFWVYLLAIIPLFLLLPSGLYMFAQPYAARSRGRQRIGGQE